MKIFKNLHYFLSVVILVLFELNTANAQIANCKNSITVSTSPWACSYTLIPLDIDDGSSDYTKLTVDKTVLNPGVHLVTLTAEKSTGVTSFCTCSVNVIDKSAPVVVAVQNITLGFNEQNSIDIAPWMIDAGSYDQCSAVTLSVSPKVINCSSPNPLRVTLTVTDAEGNYNQSWVDVNVVQNKNRKKDIECKGNLTFGVPPSGSIGIYEITADSLLEGGPYACPAYYKVVLKYNNITLPKPEVSFADVGKTFDYTVTDPETLNTCSGKVTIVGLDCTNAFKVYDRFSRCTPLGDINSGHSLLDDVEWPCDITVNNPSSFLLNDIQPYKIADFLDVSIDSIKPIFFNGVPVTNKCVLLGENLRIDDFLFENKVSITYSYINWMEQGFVPISYTQWIHFTKAEDVCIPCDTKPWNTPLGDCASGHTVNDAVEWPSDITVDFLEVSPYDLKLNPTIHPNDVEPIMNDNCSVLWSRSYSDIIFPISSSETKIERTWFLLNPLINETYTYTQKIFINAMVSNNREVCFSTVHNYPISDVEILNNLKSENSGCNTLLYDGINNTILPSKPDSDFQIGIDVDDVISLKEYVWQLGTLDPMQKMAADLNGDGNINNIDTKLLENLWTNQISSLPMHDSPWKFLNANAYFVEDKIIESSNIKSPYERYHFKGMKIGDINDSYKRDEGITKVTSFVVEDQLLTQGQDYILKPKTSTDIKVKGFQMTIEKNDAFEIAFVISPFLYIDLQDKGDYYLITGLATDNSIRSGGEYVDYMNSALKIIITAKKNAVLHDVFKLYHSENKMVQGANKEISRIQLNYENFIPTSLLDLTDQNIIVFPNPTNGIISVETFGKALNSIQIFSYDGKTLYSNTELSTNTIDISFLPNGFYTVDITMDTGLHVIKKLIKI